VDAIRRHVLAGAKLFADDRPISVRAPGNDKNRTARLWSYVRDDRPSQSDMPAAVRFAYSPDSKGIHPQTHPAAFKDIFQKDAFAGFNALFDSGDITDSACWAYARRKFHDLHEARPSAVTTKRCIGSARCIKSKPTFAAREISAIN
jgi:transposase